MGTFVYWRGSMSCARAAVEATNASPSSRQAVKILVHLPGMYWNNGLFFLHDV